NMKRILADKGFLFHTTIRLKEKEYYRDVEVLGISKRREVLRLLGQFRPPRLLSKLKLDTLGMIGPVRGDALLHKEFIGLADVVSVQTSTHTFVAEGLASHN